MSAFFWIIDNLSSSYNRCIPPSSLPSFLPLCSKFLSFSISVNISFMFLLATSQAMYQTFSNPSFYPLKYIDSGIMLAYLCSPLCTNFKTWWSVWPCFKFYHQNLFLVWRKKFHLNRSSYIFPHFNVWIFLI